MKGLSLHVEPSLLCVHTDVNDYISLELDVHCKLASVLERIEDQAANDDWWIQAFDGLNNNHLYQTGSCRNADEHI